MNDYSDEILTVLKDIYESILEARDDIDFPIQLSATMPWMIDYHNRKHLFIWSPVNLTLTLEDYGVLSLQSQTWHNLQFPAGMRVFASNISSASPVYAYVKATDENPILEYQNNIAVTGTVTANVASLPTSATGTGTSVAGSVTTVTILAANTARKGYRVFNDSTSIMYLAEFSGASTSSYTTQIPPNSLWESPVTPVYTGIVTAVWATATGNARITEMT